MAHPLRSADVIYPGPVEPCFSEGPDVLLIQPPIRDFYLTSKRTIPYGLLSIAASLQRVGFSVEIFDALATNKVRIEKLPSEFLYLEPFYGKPDTSPFCLFHQFKCFGYRFDHMAKIVKESKARFVGISSLFTAYSQEALYTAGIVKKVLPECIVVLGGHHPTILYEKVMICDDVDFVIRGEGESAFPELIKGLKEKGDLRKIPGIVFRKSDGTNFVNAPAVIKNPERFPIPAMDLNKWSYYRRKKKAAMAVVSSRGCPMKCTYCCISDSYIPYRRRSVESVLEEIDIGITRHNAGFIDFEDENISLDRKWFQRLLRTIIEKYDSNGLELRAMNGLYPPSLDGKTLKLMKVAGFKTLNLSVGTISVRQLKKFNRPAMIESLEQVLSDAEKHKLGAVVYLIAGAPGQTAKDSLCDLIYMAQKPVVIGLSMFYPAPGSVDYAYLKNKGSLPQYFSMMRSSALPVLESISHVEAVTLLRLSRIINFMKLLVKKGETIPVPDDYAGQKVIDISDRKMTGKQLLGWFLADGMIRGVTPHGEIYKHNISTVLTRQFIREMQTILVQ